MCRLYLILLGVASVCLASPVFVYRGVSSPAMGKWSLISPIRTAEASRCLTDLRKIVGKLKNVYKEQIRSVIWATEKPSHRTGKQSSNVRPESGGDRGVHRVVQNWNNLTTIADIIDLNLRTCQRINTRLIELGRKIHGDKNINNFRKNRNKILYLISTATSYGSQLQTRISQVVEGETLAAQGLFPHNIVDKKKLHYAVQTIQDGLSKFIAFAYKPRQLEQLISVMDVSVVHIKGKSYLKFLIPMISTEYKFNIYQVHNFPVVRTCQSRVYRAEFSMKLSYIGITSDKSRYIIPDENSIDKMLQHDHPFFYSKSPIKKRFNSNSCILALFRQSMKEVRKNCNIRIYLSQTRQVETGYLGNNHWLVSDPSSREHVRFECEKNAITRKPRILGKGLMHIKLSSQCKAHISNLRISPVLEISSHINDSDIEYALQRSMKVVDVWKEFSSKVGISSVDLDKRLSELPEIPNKGLSAVEFIDFLAIQRLLVSYESLSIHATVTVPLFVGVVVVVASFIVCRGNICSSGNIQPADVIGLKHLFYERNSHSNSSNFPDSYMDGSVTDSASYLYYREDPMYENL